MYQLKNTNHKTSSEIKAIIESALRNDLLFSVDDIHETLLVIIKFHHLLNKDAYAVFATVPVSNELIEISVNYPLIGATNNDCEIALASLIEPYL